MSHPAEIAKPVAAPGSWPGCNERGCCGMIPKTKSLGKAKRARAEASARS